MNTIINGLKTLNKNEYEKIVIRDIGDNFKIDVKSPKVKVDTLKTLNKLSDSFKMISDEEKILFIIQIYLENTLITGIHDKTYFQYYNNRCFSVVEGSRNLLLSLDSRKFQNSKTISKIVLNKYKTDRINFCEDNKDINSYEFWVSYGKSSYRKNSIYSKEGDIETINFCFNIGAIEFEKKFIEEFLYDKLYNIGEKATLKNIDVRFSISEGPITVGYYLICGNLRIRITQDWELRKIVAEIVSNYNNEIKNRKILQLKMEGF